MVNKLIADNIPNSVIEFLKPKGIDIKVDEFEELLLQDVMRGDDDTKIKLSRDLTQTFSDWRLNKLRKKEKVVINIKGTVRSGKSLIGLEHNFHISNFYNRDYDTTFMVCANQKEYRQKLADIEFGQNFLIDEKAFSNSGMGSMTEINQLKNVENITAKANIHTTYITPRNFLDTGAEVGLSYWGKDSNNWISRFLLYHLKGSSPQLMGYVIFDIGKLFFKNGCNIYKFTGGCSNPNRLKYVSSDDKKHYFLNMTYDKKIEIDREFIEYSNAIPKEFRTDIQKAQNKFLEKDVKVIPCPFYRVCESQLCKYELKKDTWIEKELKGGFDERESERYRLAIKMIQDLGMVNGDTISLRAKNKTALSIKIKMKLPLISNTTLTESEKGEIINVVLTLTEVELFRGITKELGLNPDEEIEKIGANNKSQIEPKDEPKPKPKIEPIIEPEIEPIIEPLGELEVESEDEPLIEKPNLSHLLEF